MNDVRDPHKLPDIAREAGRKFGEWVARKGGTSSEWWSRGNWAKHDKLCLWHAYQTISTLTRDLDPPPGPGSSSKPPSNAPEDSEGAGGNTGGFYDPVKGWR